MYVEGSVELEPAGSVHETQMTHVAKYVKTLGTIVGFLLDAL
jgi:hypothetical protein